MSRAFRRVFILNFLISSIGLVLYSQITLTFLEKEFYYLAVILFISSLIITYLITKIIILFLKQELSKLHLKPLLHHGLLGHEIYLDEI